MLPLPEELKIKGGAVTKVLANLKAKGLIDHQGMPRGDDEPPLCITRAGLEAIGVEPEDADSTPQPAKGKAKEPKPGKTASAQKPTPRTRAHAALPE